MPTLAELLDQDVVKELREKFFPLKPGFIAEKCHVKFKVHKDGITVILPSGKSVMARISDRSDMYFLEFLEDVPEGYKRRAIDAWDKVLVSEGVRSKRKIWKDKHRKKKKRKRRKKTQSRESNPKP